jgi:membrane protease YdiL (CAAX protease family)
MIISGGLMLSTTLLLTLFLDLNPSFSDTQTDSSLPLYFKLVLAPLILAPIFEEILFRGFLSKSNSIKILFFLTGFISIFLFDFHKATVLLILFLYALFASFLYTKNNFLLNLLILLSSFIFATIHYSIEELYSFQTLPFLLGKFSLALILGWIVYNNNIFAAIFFHAVWNLIVILFFLHSLQYVEKKLVVSDFEESIITYEKVPIFSSNVSSYSIDEKELIVKNMAIEDVIKYMDRKYLDTFNIRAPYMRYNIHVILKSVKDKDKLTPLIIRLLEKENLIERDHSPSSATLGQ